MSKAYRKFKPKLREEFSYACAYCGTREPEAGGAGTFHIDHYKPKSKFPHLINSYSNLIYSCRQCNGYKGEYWHGFIGWLCGEFVLNPRTNDVPSHIDKSITKWRGLTKCGRWNIDVLHLSDTVQVLRREDRKHIEKIIVETIKKREEFATLLENRHKLSTSDILDIEEKSNDCNNRIETLRRKIEGAMD